MQFHSDKLNKKSDEIKSNHNNGDQGRYKKLIEVAETTFGLMDFLNKMVWKVERRVKSN